MAHASQSKALESADDHGDKHKHARRSEHPDERQELVSATFQIRPTSTIDERTSLLSAHTHQCRPLSSRPTTCDSTCRRE
ncbi:unnamed protein product [Tilletia controversa]|nr:unnamed protein product [Tilletia controversa]CAD6977634.1 unnamed protein product [Tilletia controversa]